MTDIELLELAAKAAGYRVKRVLGSGDGLIVWIDDIPLVWNPITYDGDALRLAVKLGGELRINIEEQWASFSKEIDTGTGWFVADIDHNTATRRAIVRAAAEIGKGMK